MGGCQDVTTEHLQQLNSENRSLGKSSVGNVPAIKCSHSDVYYYHRYQIELHLPLRPPRKRYETVPACVAACLWW